MLGAKIDIKKNATGGEIADAINAAEAAVRSAVPATRVIYLEPDLKRQKARAKKTSV